MFTIDEVTTDNVLIHQKDAIIRLINDGKLVEAGIALGIVREFWQSVDYGYKVREIEARISQAEEWTFDEIIRQEG